MKHEKFDVAFFNTGLQSLQTGTASLVHDNYGKKIQDRCWGSIQDRCWGSIQAQSKDGHTCLLVRPVLEYGLVWISITAIKNKKKI